LEGAEGCSYSLIWGDEDSDNRFRFTMSPKGSFSYSYSINGEHIAVSNWVDNSAIKIDLNSNLIELVKNGELVHFKINKEVVYTNDFISFFGDKIGFSLSRNMKIAVDFIRIKN